MSASEAGQLYMGYMQLKDISLTLKMSMGDVITSIEGYKSERAKKSLRVIDLSEFVDEPPVVKMLITKLSILRHELFRRAIHDFTTLTLAEKVDNLIKRVKVNDPSEWIEKEEDIEIISETGGYVTIEWIYMAETADTDEMVRHAKVLTDKYLMRPNDIGQINAEHLEICRKLNIDPTTLSKEEAKKALSIYEDVI